MRRTNIEYSWPVAYLTEGKPAIPPAPGGRQRAIPRDWQIFYRPSYCNMQCVANSTMAHFCFLEHQNLRINLQKGFSFWSFVPGPHWGWTSPDPLAPVVQILDMPLTVRDCWSELYLNKISHLHDLLPWRTWRETRPWQFREQLYTQTMIKQTNWWQLTMHRTIGLMALTRYAIGLTD